jgi:glycosyltransferase involved in cell wall biosynthesis
MAGGSDKLHLAVVTVNGGRIGGMQKFSRHVIGAALEAGWRVTVALSGDDVYEDFTAKTPERLTVDQVDWVDTTFKGDREYRWRRIMDRRRWFSRIRPNAVLFVQSSNTPFRASVVGARLAGIPVVSTHRTMPYIKDFVPSRRYLFGLIPGLGLARRRMMLRTWLTSALAARVVYNSANLREGYEQHYRFSARKGHVIPNAVDTTVPRPREAGTNREAVTIGYVGRLGREKRLDVLFEAIAGMSVTREIRVKVYGEGPDRARLESCAKELGIADRVEWCGVTDNVWSAYAELDIVALCSPRESSSNMILEAMAAGSAVVVTDTGGLPELIGSGQYGLCVPALDVAALRGALERAIEDEALRARLGRKARAHVADRHDAAQISKAWLDLLSKASGRRCGPVFSDVAGVTGPPAARWEGVVSP